jgi:Tfp pilus assembly protein PilO
MEMADTKKQPEKVKKPSKILGEYYGSLFFVMIIAFLGVAYFVLKPMLDEVKMTNGEITTTLQTLEGNRSYLNSLESSISAAQSITPEILGQVDRALPRESEIPELLVLFGGISERDGVKIGNISFSEESSAARLARPSSTVSEITINLSVTAKNYPQIKRFLEDVQSSLRIVDVTGINVSSQGEESAYAILMKTYTYVPGRQAVPTPVQR